VAIELRETVPESARIYLKSEFGPISNDWPAVSFSKNSVGVKLRSAYNPATDLIVYVGTSNPATTENPKHRRRLLSAVRIDPHTIYDTRDLIPAKRWEESQEKYRGRWDKSFPVLKAWEFSDFPSAPDTLGAAYTRLGFMENRGNVVELIGAEKTPLSSLSVLEVQLVLQDKAKVFEDKRDFKNLPFELRRFLGILRDRLKDRVKASGTQSSRTTPIRFLDADIDILLGKKWEGQRQRCALCDGKIELRASNRLLQGSVDRIDSACPWYDEKNLQITHLACNLAKNDATNEEFEEWLAIARFEAVSEAEAIK